MANKKLGVALVASILIGVAIFAFVAFTAFDAVGFGKETEYGEPFAPTWGENQTITLWYSPANQPVVTFWDAAGAINGTVPTTNITWSGNEMYIFSWNWTDYDFADAAPYGKDTTFLRFNYTSRGGAARNVATPVIVLVAVMGVVIVAGVMISGTKKMGGGKGGRKSFP